MPFLYCYIEEFGFKLNTVFTLVAFPITIVSSYGTSFESFPLLFVFLKQKSKNAENQLKSSESSVNVREKWVESLRMLKVKLIKTRTRDARIRNNQMFEEDEGNFRNTADKKEYKGTVPSIDRFVTF